MKYEEIGENTYRVTTCPGSHPVELEGRLKRKLYEFKPGEIELERCPACGVPRDVARLSWDLEEGMITDPDSGWRRPFTGRRLYRRSSTTWSRNWERIYQKRS